MTKQTVGERTAELERKRLRRADGSAPGEPISITSSPSVRKRAQALTSRLCLTGCSLAALLCLASAASESITESVQLAAVSGEEERQGRQVAPSESKAFPVPDLLLMARLFNPGAQSGAPIEPPEPEPERTVAPPTQTTGHSDAPTAANSGSHLLLLLFVLLALINLIVILGNILVIVAFYATAKLRNVTNIFIVSLATADLLLGLLVLPYALMFEILDVWIFGQVWCRGWLVTDVWISTASILNLCAISVDRYVAVTRPVKYRSIMTPRRAKTIVAGVWIVSFLICFPPLLPQWKPVESSASPSPGALLKSDWSAQVSPVPGGTLMRVRRSIDQGLQGIQFARRRTGTRTQYDDNLIGRAYYLIGQRADGVRFSANAPTTEPGGRRQTTSGALMMDAVLCASTTCQRAKESLASRLASLTAPNLKAADRTATIARRQGDGSSRQPEAERSSLWLRLLHPTSSRGPSEPPAGEVEPRSAKHNGRTIGDSSGSCDCSCCCCCCCGLQTIIIIDNNNNNNAETTPASGFWRPEHHQDQRQDDGGSTAQTHCCLFSPALERVWPKAEPKAKRPDWPPRRCSPARNGSSQLELVCLALDRQFARLFRPLRASETTTTPSEMAGHRIRRSWGLVENGRTGFRFISAARLSRSSADGFIVSPSGVVVVGARKHTKRKHDSQQRQWISSLSQLYGARRRYSKSKSPDRELIKEGTSSPKEPHENERSDERKDSQPVEQSVMKSSSSRWQPTRMRRLNGAHRPAEAGSLRRPARDPERVDVGRRQGDSAAALWRRRFGAILRASRGSILEKIELLTRETSPLSCFGFHFAFSCSSAPVNVSSLHKAARSIYCRRRALEAEAEAPPTRPSSSRGSLATDAASGGSEEPDAGRIIGEHSNCVSADSWLLLLSNQPDEREIWLPPSAQGHIYLFEFRQDDFFITLGDNDTDYKRRADVVCSPVSLEAGGNLSVGQRICERLLMQLKLCAQEHNEAHYHYLCHCRASLAALGLLLTRHSGGGSRANRCWNGMEENNKDKSGQPVLSRAKRQTNLHQAAFDWPNRQPILAGSDKAHSALPEVAGGGGGTSNGVGGELAQDGDFAQSNQRQSQGGIIIQLNPPIPAEATGSAGAKKSGCALFDHKSYVIYSALGSFYIPMLIMLFFYSRIYLVASRAQKALQRGYMTTKWPPTPVRTSGGRFARGAGTGTDSLKSAGSCNGGGGCSPGSERVTLRIHRREKAKQELAGEPIELGGDTQKRSTQMRLAELASAAANTLAPNDKRDAKPQLAAAPVADEVASTATVALNEPLNDPERADPQSAETAPEPIEPIGPPLPVSGEDVAGASSCQNRLTDCCHKAHHHHNHNQQQQQRRHHHHGHHHHHHHRRNHHHRHHHDQGEPHRAGGCVCAQREAKHFSQRAASKADDRGQLTAREGLMASCIAEEAPVAQSSGRPVGIESPARSERSSVSSVQITVSQYEQAPQDNSHSAGGSIRVDVGKIHERSLSVDVARDCNQRDSDTAAADSLLDVNCGHFARLDRSHSCGPTPTIVVNWNPETGATDNSVLASGLLAKPAQQAAPAATGSQGSGLSLMSSLPLAASQVRKQSMMLLSSITTRSSQTLRRLSMVATHPVESLLSRAGAKSRDDTAGTPTTTSDADEHLDGQLSAARKLKAGRRSRRRRNKLAKSRSEPASAAPKRTLDDYLMAVAGVDRSSDEDEDEGGEDDDEDDEDDEDEDDDDDEEADRARPISRYSLLVGQDHESVLVAGLVLAAETRDGGAPEAPSGGAERAPLSEEPAQLPENLEADQEEPVRPPSALHRQGAYYERATSRAGKETLLDKAGDAERASHNDPIRRNQATDSEKQVVAGQVTAAAALATTTTTKITPAPVAGTAKGRRRGAKRTSRWHAKRLHAETKAAKTVAIIIGGFIFCWLPFFTAYLSRAIICERPDCIPQSLLSVFIWLGYLNSAINPLIYGLFSTDFRHAFKNIICRCRFRNTDDTVVVSVLVDSIIKSIL